MGLDLNPLDWPADLLQFAATSPPVEDLVSFALQHILGFDPPWSLVRLALMLEGDAWSTAQQAANVWVRMESRGFDPWRLLGQILDGIASVGPGGYVREQIRDFWRPIWQAMDQLEVPTTEVEAFIYAAQDALNVEMRRMLEGQQARATDQVSVDNAKMQAALAELETRFTQNRRTNETLREALQTIIPDAAGLAANGVDLVELILILAAIISTGGVDLLALPEELAGIVAEDIDIFSAGIIAGYDAIAAWLVAQSRDLNPVPRQIAEVAANPPPSWIPTALLADEKTLEENGCPIPTIRSFMSNPQITQGYIHDIVNFHPQQACIILSSINTILTIGNPTALGGLVATEDDLRLSGIMFTGALFHIQWMAHHPGQISGIEVPVAAGDRPDVLTTGGTVLDCKSVLEVGDYSSQIAKYVANFPGQPIEYAFNGDKLVQDSQNNLAKLKKMAQGLTDKETGQKLPPVTIDVAFSAAEAATPEGKSFIAQLEALKAQGLPVQVEIWQNLVSV